jgi:hypothetical protein
LAIATNGAAETGLVKWASDPDGCGTLSVISSCVLTFVLCIWCVLHLNVPPLGVSDCWFTREKTL